jgi:hypothetical protein
MRMRALAMTLHVLCDVYGANAKVAAITVSPRHNVVNVDPEGT